MSALAVIRTDALQLYYSDRATPVGGSIPHAAISDMEVASEAELTRAVSQLVPMSASPVTVVLAIADELCFAVPQKGENEEEVKNRLINLTPFSQVALANVVAQKESYIVATNQDLYESYARSLAPLHHSVVLVVPWMALLQAGLTKGEIDSITVKRVFDALSSLRPQSFPWRIETNEVPANSSGQIMQRKGSKLSWGWIVFGAVALLYAMIMFWFYMRGT